MNETQVIVYGFVILWFAIVITHALTIAYSIPENKVVEVREVIRTVVDIQRFILDFAIDERDYMRGNPQEIAQRMKRNMAMRLCEELPESMFEFIEYSNSPLYHGTRHTVTLMVLPPHKRNSYL
jgi:hypothetical protein